MNLLITSDRRIIFYNQMNNMHNNEASWAIFIQFISLMLMMLGGWIFRDTITAASLGLGGALCLIPNACMYRSAFKYQGATQAKAIVKGLYIGAALKMILTFGLFGFVLRYIIWASMLYVFIGYVVIQLTFWVSPLYFGLKNKA